MPKRIETGAPKPAKKSRATRTKGLPASKKNRSQTEEWSAEKWWAETDGRGDLEKLTIKQSREVIELGRQMGRIRFTAIRRPASAKKTAAK